MITRSPIAAGQFYPRDKQDLENTINKFMRRVRVEERKIKGCVSPHAGYLYSGVTQAHIYKTISNENPVFLIIGPNHLGSGSPLSIMSSGIWKTSLGEARIESELGRRIKENTGILDEDLQSHSQEHSIEVQLPWLQYKFDNFSFIPILITTKMFDSKDLKELGKKIGEVCENYDREVIFIASSDFTHFGASYGYQPVSGSPQKKLDFIEEVDKEAASAIENLDPKGFEAIVNKYSSTICGRDAISLTLYILEDKAKKGELLHYSTSYEVSGDPYAIVGYCGIIIE